MLDGRDQFFRIGLRRAVVIGLCAGCFALLVIVTTRETVSGCDDVTDAQRGVLATLRDPDAALPFRTTEDARCREGEFSAPIVGLADEMEAATHELEAAGWRLETDYIAFHLQIWRRCFGNPLAGWERVQVTVDATRGGNVRSVRAIAPENVDACELERRETSDIYPPSE